MEKGQPHQELLLKQWHNRNPQAAKSCKELHYYRLETFTESFPKKKKTQTNLHSAFSKLI